MKHIVIDARESGTSTGRYIDKLLEYLAKEKPKYRVTVLTKPQRVDFIKKIAPGFSVIESKYKEFTFAEQIGYLKQIKDLDADLVHFGMVQQPVLYRGKVVTTMHDLTTARFNNTSKNWLVFKFKQSVYKRVNKWVARKSAAIITPTQYVKDDVARFADVNSRKITITYEAADKITNKAEPVEELIGKQFILYVGRPQPHKNLERLVEATKLIQSDLSEVHLVFAGKKDVLYKKLARFAKKSGVTHTVFTDFVTEGQLRWLYENAGTYAFPSLSEGFGLPGLEAMIHGCPVVSSNATCLPEVYKDAALYFDPTDINDMAAQITKVLKDKRLAESLKSKGKTRASKFSWDQTAKQTLEVYNSILREN